jgi:hypothetical protein
MVFSLRFILILSPRPIYLFHTFPFVFFLSSHMLTPEVIEVPVLLRALL